MPFSDVKAVTTVSNVAEIFNAAGFAFKKLSEMVSLLDTHKTDSSMSNGDSVSNGHWDQADIDQFKSIVKTFNDDLGRLGDSLKGKISNQLKEEHEARALAGLTPAERDIISKKC